jgi:xylulokinase
LGKKEYDSGLSFGPHVIEDEWFWMGGLPASGGSVEWLRRQLGDEPLAYEEIEQRLSRLNREPSGILYYPYLSGSGAPRPDKKAKAAIVGLTMEHTKDDLLKAVFEGTGYEMESVRRTAESICGQPIAKMIAVGGGTKNRRWMQMKADISNCRLAIPPFTEATLLGAALTAGIGCGLYDDRRQALAALNENNRGIEEVVPDDERHRAYRSIYEQGYMGLQDPLRQYFS